MDFIYASDDANAKAVAVSATSLVNSNPSARVVVVADRWSSHNKEMLLRSLGSDGNLLLRETKVQDLPSGKDHISSATFLRLLIPDLFPEISECVYLDADTLVRNNLDGLKSYISREHFAGGVRASETPTLGSAISSWRQDGLNPHANYINAGVLWMNLDKWRREDLGPKCLQWFARNPASWVDNDAICATLGEQISLLPLRYNATIHMMRPASKVYGFEPTSEVDKARSDPAIVHFTGAIKPWHRNATMPYLSEWRVVAERVGWKNFQHSFTLRRRLAKTIISLVDQVQ